MKLHFALLALLFSSQLCIGMDDWYPKNPLNKPCTKGDIEQVRRLLDERVSLDAEYNRALHNAARYGHLEIVQLLLARGIDPNIKTKAAPGAIPDTPLEMMSIHTPTNQLSSTTLISLLQIVRELVAHGANPNEVDVYGNTPLHYCAKYPLGEYRKSVAQAVLENGANPFQKNNGGLTPLERNTSLPIYNSKMFQILKNGEDNFKRRIRMNLHGTPRPTRRRVQIAKRPSVQTTHLLEKPLPKWNGKLEDE